MKKSSGKISYKQEPMTMTVVSTDSYAKIKILTAINRELGDCKSIDSKEASLIPACLRAAQNLGFIFEERDNELVFVQKEYAGSY